MTAARFIDPDALERSLTGLRRDSTRGGLLVTLDRVIDATRQLFGADGAGIMMVDESSALAAVAATDDAGHQLEVRQQETGFGPCVDALVLDRVVVTEDLAADDRWPALVPELPDLGVRAVLGIPLHVAGMPIGSLNVYRTRPADFGDSEIRALEAYAELVESMLDTALHVREQEQLATQLQHALDHRVTIERAVGVVMARERIDPVEAFNQLRRVARSSERRVADVAAELIGAIPSKS